MIRWTVSREHDSELSGTVECEASGNVSDEWEQNGTNSGSDIDPECSAVSYSNAVIEDENTSNWVLR